MRFALTHASLLKTSSLSFVVPYPGVSTYMIPSSDSFSSFLSVSLKSPTLKVLFWKSPSRAFPSVLLPEF